MVGSGETAGPAAQRGLVRQTTRALRDYLAAREVVNGVQVAAYATGGVGTAADPYTGWDTETPWAQPAIGAISERTVSRYNGKPSLNIVAMEDGTQATLTPSVAVVGGGRGG